MSQHVAMKIKHFSRSSIVGATRFNMTTRYEMYVQNDISGPFVLSLPLDFQFVKDIIYSVMVIIRPTISHKTLTNVRNF
jgi:hypothetical protein